MAKVTFKDKKTGKAMKKTNVDRLVKKSSKPKVKKRGLKYSPLKPSQESGEGIRTRAKVRSAKYSQDMAGTKTKKKMQMRKYFNNDYEEGK